MLKSVRLLCLLAAGLLPTSVLLAQMPSATDAERLGVQSCDTECQTRETDCDLACDQVVACVEECKKASAICAQECRDAPPAPSKPDSSAKPSAPSDKTAPSAKAPPPKAPPPKAPPAKPKAA